MPPSDALADPKFLAMAESDRNPPKGLERRWLSFWVGRSGAAGFGRFAAWVASHHSGPFHQRARLANLLGKGFIAPSARVTHPDVKTGLHVIVGDGTIISRVQGGGPVELKDRAHIYGNSFLDTGLGAKLIVGEGSHIQPDCHLHAQVEDIRIGRRVEIAAGCGFYSYDHGMAPGIPIMEQELTSKGPIIVGDDVWIGYNATILHGVTIGDGAVVAAGAVVNRDVPENAIVGGVPAKVIGWRKDGETVPEKVVSAAPIT